MKCISGKTLSTTSSPVCHVCIYSHVNHRYVEYMYTCHLVVIVMHRSAYNLIAGEFVGFTDLGDINTHVANFKAQLESGTVPTKPLVKSVLVLMVRGLNSGLQFPYAQFPCASLRGDQLFHIVWRAIGRLQRYGFHVLGLTCDGLAANRHVPAPCA